MDLKKLRIRSAGTLVALFSILGLLTACGSAEYRASLASCSPSYDPHSTYGSFSVQQKASGAAIQYGLYPNAKYAGTRYWLVVKISGKKKPYDAKNQSYPPHGSIDAKTATQYKGKTLTL